jgi:hypothetical protein
MVQYTAFSGFSEPISSSVAQDSQPSMVGSELLRPGATRIFSQQSIVTRVQGHEAWLWVLHAHHRQRKGPFAYLYFFYLLCILIWIYFHIYGKVNLFIVLVKTKASGFLNLTPLAHNNVTTYRKKMKQEPENMLICRFSCELQLLELGDSLSWKMSRLASGLLVWAIFTPAWYFMRRS